MKKWNHRSFILSNKKRLGVGLLIILGLLMAAVAIYIGLNGVSRADYSLAAQKTNATITAFNTSQAALAKYRDAAIDSSTTVEELETLAKSFSQARSDYAESAKELSDLRALRDDDIRRPYDVFIAKNPAFSAQMTTLASVLPNIHKKTINCSESAIGKMDTGNLAKVVAAYDAATAPCINVMKGLANSKSAEAVAVAKKALDYFADMRTHAVAMQAAYKADNRKKFQSEYKAFLAKANEFSKDTDTSSVTDLTRLTPPSDELNQLMAALQAALK